MIRNKYKIIMIIGEILLFISFYLPWFGGDKEIQVLRATDLKTLFAWLIILYIGTWFSIFTTSRNICMFSLIATTSIFVLEVIGFLTWHYQTITGYISLSFFY